MKLISLWWFLSLIPCILSDCVTNLDSPSSWTPGNFELCNSAKTVKIIYQEDGNLVGKRISDGTILWNLGQYSTSKFTLEATNKLVLWKWINSQEVPVWILSTSGGNRESAYVTVTDSAQFQIDVITGCISRLYQYEILSKGDTWCSLDNSYKLTYQQDGNVVIRDGSNQITWSSSTVGSWYLRLEWNNAIVIYNSNYENMWFTGGLGIPSTANATVESDGLKLWFSCKKILTFSEKLYPGGHLCDDDLNFALYLKSDGNFIGYRIKSGQQVWNSGTSGNPDYFVTFLDVNTLTIGKYNQWGWYGPWNMGCPWGGARYSAYLTVSSNGQPSLAADYSKCPTVIYPYDVYYPTNYKWCQYEDGSGAYCIYNTDANVICYNSQGTAVFNAGKTSGSTTYLYMNPNGNFVFMYQGPFGAALASGSLSGGATNYKRAGRVASGGTGFIFEGFTTTTSTTSSTTTLTTSSTTSTSTESTTSSTSSSSSTSTESTTSSTSTESTSSSSTTTETSTTSSSTSTESTSSTSTESTMSTSTFSTSSTTSSSSSSSSSSTKTTKTKTTSSTTLTTTTKTTRIKVTSSLLESVTDIGSTTNIPSNTITSISSTGLSSWEVNPNDPLENLIPGGTLSVTSKDLPSDPMKICHKDYDITAVEDGSRQVEGILEFKNLPIFENVLTKVSMTFVCNGNGTGYDDLVVVFNVKAQFNLLGSELPMLIVDVTYDVTKRSMVGQTNLGKLGISFDMTFKDSFLLNSITIKALEPLDVNDLETFPFPDVAESVKSSGLNNLIAGVQLNDLSVSYKANVSCTKSTQTNRFALSVGGGANFLNFNAGLYLTFDQIVKYDFITKNVTNGTEIVKSINSTSSTLTNATVTVLVDSSGSSTNVKLYIPVSGLCSGKTTTATIQLTPSENMPLVSPITIQSQANISCSDSTSSFMSYKAIEKREMEHPLWHKDSDNHRYVPRYQRPLKKRASEQTLKGFSLKTFAKDLPFKLFDSTEPTLISGELYFDSFTKSFAFHGQTSLFAMNVDFTRDWVNYTKLIAGEKVQQYDYSFDFLADGPISLANLPFENGLKNSFDVSSVSNVVISNVHASYTKTTFKNNDIVTYNETFSFGGSARIDGPGDSIGITVNVDLYHDEGLDWDGHVSAIVEAKLDKYAHVKATGGFPLGCMMDNVTANTGVEGWIGNLPGLNGNISLVGTLDATVQCNKTGNNALWNTTVFKLALEAKSDVSLTILDKPTKGLDSVKLKYDSEIKVLELGGTLKIPSADFAIQSRFNLDDAHEGKRLEYLSFEATVKSLSLDALPVDGLDTSLKQGGGDALFSGSDLSGYFKISYKSIPPIKINDTINDVFSLQAQVSSSIFDADVSIAFTRFQMSLNDTPSRWYLQNATVGINTTYGTLRLTATGEPCDNPLTLKAKLTKIPLLTKPLEIYGTAAFKCQKIVKKTELGDETESKIISTNIKANATLGFDLFDSSFTVATEIGYFSDQNNTKWSIQARLNSLYLNADINDPSNYSLAIGAKDVGFADLPFGDSFKEKLKDVKVIDGLKFKAVNIEYTSEKDVSKVKGVLIFSDRVKDGVQLDAKLEARFMKNGTEWKMEYVQVVAGLYVSDIDSFIDLSFKYACPTGISGNFGGLFRNLPLGIQPLQLNGSLSIPCKKSGGANMSAWELSVVLPRKITFPNIPILPSDFGIPAGTQLTYSKAKGIFNVTWPLGAVGNSGRLVLNIQFGSGVKDPYGNKQKQTNGDSVGVRLSGKFVPNAGQKNVEVSLGDIVQKFGDLTGGSDGILSKLGLGGISGPGTAITNELNKVKFVNPVLDVDPKGTFINFRCGVDLWGIKTAILFTGKKEDGKWQFAFGFPIAIPPGGVGLPEPLKTLVNVGGMQFEHIFFGAASGSLTLDVPADALDGVTRPFEVNIPQGGIALHGTLGMGNSGDMAKVQSDTGDFGDSLSESGSLSFSIVISSKGLSLDIAFALSKPTCDTARERAHAVAIVANKLLKRGQMCTQSSTEYTGLVLRLAIKFSSPGVGFGFMFDVKRNLGGDMMRFRGGIQLDLSVSGATLEGFFIFDGKWKNPLGISPNLVIYHVDLSLGIDLNTMLPLKFGMGITASLDGGKYGYMTIDGGLQVDLKNLGTGDNAMYMNVTSFSLAVVVYGFIPTFPSGAGDFLSSMSIGYAFISVNTAAQPMTFPSGMVVNPGFFLDIRDMNLFNLVYVIQARIELSLGDDPYLNASMELKKVDLGGVIQITRFTDPNKGPYGALWVYPKKEIGYVFDGRIVLFKIMEIGVHTEFSLNLEKRAFKQMLEGRIILWDIATATIFIAAEADSPTNFRQQLRLELDVHYSGGLLAGLVDKTLGRLTQVVSENAEKWITTVQQWVDDQKEAGRRKFQAALDALEDARRWAKGVMDGARASLNGVRAWADNERRIAEEIGCAWYKPWACVESAFHWMLYELAMIVVRIAEGVFNAIEAVINLALDVAAGVVNLARVVFNALLDAMAAIVKAALQAIVFVLQAITNALKFVAGLVNLQYLLVEDYIDSSGQMDFHARFKVGFAGSPPMDVSLMFSINFASMITRFWSLVRQGIAEMIAGIIRPFSKDVADTVYRALKGSKAEAKLIVVPMEEKPLMALPFVDDVSGGFFV